MDLVELYITGAILANALYFKKLQDMNREIKDTERESAAVFEAVSSISARIKNN